MTSLEDQIGAGHQLIRCYDAFNARTTPSTAFWNSRTSVPLGTP